MLLAGGDAPHCPCVCAGAGEVQAVLFVEVFGAVDADAEQELVVVEESAPFVIQEHTVGLHLGFTKNFSESSEAKQYDHLDPQAVLRNYSQQIAEAEAKAWSLTHEWDSSIPEITPEYTDKFRVSNIYEDFKSLVLAENMDLPEGLRRLNLRGVLDTILEITKLRLTQDQYADLLKEIKADERFKDTYVMLTTADARQAEAYEPIADFVMVKPISFVQLRDLTARLKPK